MRGTNKLLAGVITVSATIVLTSQAEASLIARWTFNETGTVAHDVSGVGGAANGALAGGATLAGDGYLSLDGSTGYVDFGVPGKLANVPGGYTIEAWVLNVAPSAGGHEPLIFGQDPTSLGLTMYYSSFYTYASNANTAAAYFNAENLMLLTATYDQATKELIIYRNGVLSNSITTSLSSFNASGSLSFLAGANKDLTQFLSGKIDEISYYDGALTPDQILANYTLGPSTAPVPEPGALALLGAGTLLALRRRRVG